jgi:hypothetical protein
MSGGCHNQPLESIVAWNIARIQCPAYTMHAWFNRIDGVQGTWRLEMRTGTSDDQSPPCLVVDEIVVDSVRYPFTSLYLVAIDSEQFELRFDADGTSLSFHVAGSINENSPVMMVCDDVTDDLDAALPVSLADEVNLVGVQGKVTHVDGITTITVGDPVLRVDTDPMARSCVLISASIKVTQIEISTQAI